MIGIPAGGRQVHLGEAAGTARLAVEEPDELQPVGIRGVRSDHDGLTGRDRGRQRIDRQRGRGPVEPEGVLRPGGEVQTRLGPHPPAVLAVATAPHAHPHAGGGNSVLVEGGCKSGVGPDRQLQEVLRGSADRVPAQRGHFLVAPVPAGDADQHRRVHGGGRDGERPGGPGREVPHRVLGVDRPVVVPVGQVGRRGVREFRGTQRQGGLIDDLTHAGIGRDPQHVPTRTPLDIIGGSRPGEGGPLDIDRRPGIRGEQARLIRTGGIEVDPALGPLVEVAVVGAVHQPDVEVVGPVAHLTGEIEVEVGLAGPAVEGDR